MKLLFDHNLSPSLINRLRDFYDGSNHVYNLNLDQVSDTEVWEYAKKEGFSIVTKDADLSDLCTLKGFPPKIIWIRRGNCKTANIEVILRNHFHDIQALNNDKTTGIITLF